MKQFDSQSCDFASNSQNYCCYNVRVLLNNTILRVVLNNTFLQVILRNTQRARAEPNKERLSGWILSATRAGPEPNQERPSGRSLSPSRKGSAGRPWAQPGKAQRAGPTRKGLWVILNNTFLWVVIKTSMREFCLPTMTSRIKNVCFGLEVIYLGYN